MKPIRISIIVVNFNGEKTLKECLDSIIFTQTQYTFEIIVVDNASEDKSLEILDRYQKEITLIKNNENRGFSAANNQGISIAKGEFIFLFNNDAVLLDDTLTLLYEYLSQHADVGAIGPKLLNKDGSIQYAGSILGRWRFGERRPQSVTFLSGAAFFTRKTLLDEIGGLDEHFFFYNEDIDLCKQIMKKKLKLIYLPDISVIHYGGVSTGTRKAASIKEGIIGGLYLCKKHYPKPIYYLYKIILTALLLILLPFFWLTKNRNFQYYKADLMILTYLFKDFY